ncbi:hypothetical protein Q7C36_015072 [Tachysurus vachellii]|uniref:Uncharacterized protein n=1 Tax=Tachysurus vachellii TaxID=175792 RepID=A0AA88MBM7_TACVA|nr:hypothetical protein Q7C36_015072 [Tachysurus vachellii]
MLGNLADIVSFSKHLRGDSIAESSESWNGLGEEGMGSARSGLCYDNIRVLRGESWSVPPVGASLFGNSEHGPDDRLEKVSSVRLASVVCVCGEMLCQAKLDTSRSARALVSSRQLENGTQL